MAAEGPLTGISTIRATDAAQTRTAYQKIKAILAAKSDHLRDVVRPVAYLARHARQASEQRRALRWA
jgi:enamine deaminase RidA (YjgF/YER057c/UK114 family)